MSKLTFFAIYAMDFGHRITSATPKLDILTFLLTHTRLLKAHTKLPEAHTRLLEPHTRLRYKLNSIYIVSSRIMKRIMKKIMKVEKSMNVVFICS